MNTSHRRVVWSENADNVRHTGGSYGRERVKSLDMTFFKAHDVPWSCSLNIVITESSKVTFLYSLVVLEFNNGRKTVVVEHGSK